MSSNHRTTANKVASNATPATSASVAPFATNATFGVSADRIFPSSESHLAPAERRPGPDFNTELHRYWFAYREELTRVLVLLHGELGSSVAWAMEISLARFPQPPSATISLGEKMLKMLILDDLPDGYGASPCSKEAEGHNSLGARAQRLRDSLEGVLSVFRRPIEME